MNPDNLYFTISPQSRLDDMRALLDSYGVEILRNDKVFLSVPLVFLSVPLPWVASSPPPPGPFRWPDTTIDTTLEFRMTEWPAGFNEKPAWGRDKRRWPFFVADPLEIMFTLGDQWFSFKFSPGKEYRERSIRNAGTL